MVAKRLIQFFAVVTGITFLLTVVVFIALTVQANQPTLRALIGMDIGVALLWIIIVGLLMWISRDAVRAAVAKIPLDWRITFILFCTLLAMAEEAVTTLMTNLAPWFGVAVGQVYITASANYWDVIWGHSVIILIPTFITWAFMLKRWNFKPNEVLLMYGIFGTIVETAFGSPITLIGLWMFVYGLMMYLPAYCIPEERGAKDAHWWDFILAIFIPFISMVIFYPVILFIHKQWPSTATMFPPVKID